MLRIWRVPRDRIVSGLDSSMDHQKRPRTPWWVRLYVDLRGTLFSIRYSYPSPYPDHAAIRISVLKGSRGGRDEHAGQVNARY